MIWLLGELPALPLHEAGKYVAGAYIVLFVVVLIYVSIMAVRLSRTERRLSELLEASERASAAAAPTPEAIDVGRPPSAPVGARSR